MSGSRPLGARVVAGTGGLAAALALFVAAPIGLSWLTRRRFGSTNPLSGVRPPWSWRREEIDSSVSRPIEDDTVADVVIRLGIVVAWVALAVLFLTTALEVVHLVRHRGLPSPARRGVRWAQPTARFVAAGLVALLPLNSGAPSPIEPLASTTQEAEYAALERAVSPTGDRSAPSVDDTGGAADVRHDGVRRARVDLRSSERVHVVVRGESVWTIAAQIAGLNGAASDAETMRIAELILDRNLGTTMNDGSSFDNAALVRPGWELLVPAPNGRGHAENGAAPTPATDDESNSGPDDELVDPTGSLAERSEETAPESEAVFVVEQGDTLWSIADEELGDPALWPSIAATNLGRTMGDGRVFRDPDLIVPGWNLVVAPDAAAGGQDDAGEHDAGGDHGSSDVDVSGGDDESDHVAEAVDGAAIDELDWFDTGDERADAEHAPSVTASPSTTAATTTSTTTTSPSTTSATATTTSTAAVPATTSVPAGGPVGEPTDDGTITPDRPTAPSSPLGIEHAAMLAGGLLAVVTVRRRRQLRSARRTARRPDMPPSITRTERALRSISDAERRARLDVALRAVAAAVVGSGHQPVVVLHRDDGRVEVVLTGSVDLPEPWQPAAGSTPGSDPALRSTDTWTLPASATIEQLVPQAGSSGDPMPALAAVGVLVDPSVEPTSNEAGGPSSVHTRTEVFVDVEAAGLLTVAASPQCADAVVAAVAATLATSLAAETAHLIGVGLDDAALVDHPNASLAPDAHRAFGRALQLVGTTATAETGTFDLRTRRTGGEVWEPAIVLLSSVAGSDAPFEMLPAAGHGVAVVAAGSAPGTGGASLEATDAGWSLYAAGRVWPVRPFGLDAESLRSIDEFATGADATDATDEPADPVAVQTDDGLRDTPSSVFPWPVDSDSGAEHSIIVRLLGGVAVQDVEGTERTWQRSKTIELIAWLATHRDRPTRTKARHAMWVDDVRDATFANIVSEARRGLARLVPPPEGEEWIPRTFTDELMLHPRVRTDAELLRTRLHAARGASPDVAIALLRPAVERIGGAPFADTDYLWPDAEGLVTDLTLLATSACTELAELAVSEGDTDTAFLATGRSLTVLPGHEESIALRMRAHASRGDLAGVRSEWESYERVLHADAWSDGEPAPELLELRRELLSS